MNCGGTIYCTHTSSIRFGIFQFFGPYIFPRLPNDFLIRFRFYRHTTARNVYPCPILLGEATLNRAEVEQGKITLDCFDQSFDRHGFQILYDPNMTENITLPPPLSEWDSDTDSDS